jgi:hypothetical protein
VTSLPQAWAATASGAKKLNSAFFPTVRSHLDGQKRPRTTAVARGSQTNPNGHEKSPHHHPSPSQRPLLRGRRRSRRSFGCRRRSYAVDVGEWGSPAQHQLHPLPHLAAVAITSTSIGSSSSIWGGDQLRSRRHCARCAEQQNLHRRRLPVHTRTKSK